MHIGYWLNTHTHTHTHTYIYITIYFYSQKQEVVSIGSLSGSTTNCTADDHITWCEDELWWPPHAVPEGIAIGYGVEEERLLYLQHLHPNVVVLRAVAISTAAHSALHGISNVPEFGNKQEDVSNIERKAFQQRMSNCIYYQWQP